MRLLLAPAFLAAALPLAAAELPVPVTLAQARENYAAAVDGASAVGREEREALHAKYAAALERLQADFQAANNIEAAIAVDEERQRFAAGGTPGSSVIPRIAQLQLILRKALIPLDRDRAAALATLRATQLENLAKLRENLGDTGEVAATDREIARLRAEARSAAVFVPGLDPSVSPDVMIPPDSVGAAELASGFVTDESFSIERGSYDLTGRIHLRKGAAAVLYVPPGTALREASILVSGSSTFYAHGAYFSDGVVRVDLNGVFRGDGSLFDNCNFDKGGPWNSRLFNSKWIFRNCVFRGSFIPRIRSKSHGVQVTNCTFHDVVFEPFLYREDSDAGKEAVHVQRTFEACRFVGCTVPADLLLCSVDCLFENCTFTDPLPIPAATPVAATIHTLGSAPAYRELGPKITLAVAPAAALRVPVGATLLYDIRDGRLAFSGGAPPAAAKAPAAAPTPSRARPRVPSDAVVFQGHAYKRFEEDLTWEQARARCEALGGYLTCVGNEQEADFLRTLLSGGGTWIGLRRASRDRWEWLDRSPFLFTHWHPKAILDRSTDTAARLGAAGLWNPSPADRKWDHYICEWDWTPLR